MDQLRQFSPASSSGAQSVDRALQILSRVGQKVDEGISLSEMVRESGLAKPTVRRLLLALSRSGFIEQDPMTRRYFPGREIYILGSLATRRFGLLKLALPSLARLARASGDAAFLSVKRENHAVCLHREDGDYPVKTHALQAGYEHPLGVGAGSLAMLAALNDDMVETVIDAIRPEIERAYPSCSEASMRQAIIRSRQAGYALNPGLIYKDSWGVGIAIQHPAGGVAGAFSIAAVESRLQPERQRELAALLREEAQTVERKLKDMFTQAGPVMIG
ncbi:IclR family transcriptional regulator [Qingshengfaniella alkalisoli]|uniref:IclR family transcriptional regulator n=1 Tax=Qingshengfaniella alkalisoli TaxID=2599296 RepID=A0A5B8I9I4_9RHOB|nr:IclR family transcriptional regulator [Qingshengfaniella alkalisoli]QDY69636.1 IclR family transcriptional regulator [Qingshengfaniella alkalisoli]